MLIAQKLCPVNLHEKTFETLENKAVLPEVNREHDLRVRLVFARKAKSISSNLSILFQS